MSSEQYKSALNLNKYNLFKTIQEGQLQKTFSKTYNNTSLKGDWGLSALLGAKQQAIQQNSKGRSLHKEKSEIYEQIKKTQEEMQRDEVQLYQQKQLQNNYQKEMIQQSYSRRLQGIYNLSEIFNVGSKKPQKIDYKAKMSAPVSRQGNEKHRSNDKLLSAEEMLLTSRHDIFEQGNSQSRIKFKDPDSHREHVSNIHINNNSSSQILLNNKNNSFPSSQQISPTNNQYLSSSGFHNVNMNNTSNRDDFNTRKITDSGLDYHLYLLDTKKSSPKPMKFHLNLKETLVSPILKSDQLVLSNNGNEIQNSFQSILKHNYQSGTMNNNMSDAIRIQTQQDEKSQEQQSANNKFNGLQSSKKIQRSKFRVVANSNQNNNLLTVPKYPHQLVPLQNSRSSSPQIKDLKDWLPPRKQSIGPLLRMKQKSLKDLRETQSDSNKKWVPVNQTARDLLFSSNNQTPVHSREGNRSIRLERFGSHGLLQQHKVANYRTEPVEDQGNFIGSEPKLNSREGKIMSREKGEENQQPLQALQQLLLLSKGKKEVPQVKGELKNLNLLMKMKNDLENENKEENKQRYIENELNNKQNNNSIGSTQGDKPGYAHITNGNSVFGLLEGEEQKNVSLQNGQDKSEEAVFVFSHQNIRKKYPKEKRLFKV